MAEPYIDQIGKVVLVRSVVAPFADDADFALAQDYAALVALSIDKAVDRLPKKRRLAVYVGFFTAAGSPVQSDRGSFDMQPVLATADGHVLDGEALAGCIGWRRYLLDDLQRAERFTMRFTNIVAPATTDEMRLYVEALAL